MQMGGRNVFGGKVVVILLLFLAAWSDGVHVIDVTTQSFDDKVGGKNNTAFVKFYAPWCYHCKTMAGQYERLARRVHEEYTGITITQVDGHSNPELLQRFSIEGYPTILLLREGVLADKGTYDGVKEEEHMLKWLQRSVPEMKIRAGVRKKRDRCYNVALARNGAHAESDGMQLGHEPSRAIDGIIHVKNGRNGWSYNGNLQVAVWLVAFDEPHEIQRIRVHSGVGYPDHHLTAFRILYCNEKGAAYFSGYDRQSCWKAMGNLTGVTVALDGEKLVKVKKRQRSNVSVRRGVKMAELALPPLEASGISIQVQETDHVGNNGLLTEVEVYTEPPCNWIDGCSRYERGVLDAIEAAKEEELKSLTRSIKEERVREEEEATQAQEAHNNATREANELLEQAETQFRVSNLQGKYGAMGLLMRAREKLEVMGLGVEDRAEEFQALEAKYRQAVESQQARVRGEQSAQAAKKQGEEEEIAERARKKDGRASKAREDRGGGGAGGGMERDRHEEPDDDDDQGMLL